MPITTIPNEVFEHPCLKEIMSLGEKALPCKVCGSSVRIVKDMDTIPENKVYITINCENNHARLGGWYTDPKDMKDVLADLIKKWNEANAK